VPAKKTAARKSGTKRSTKKGASRSTRTSSRSAKRRSPKPDTSLEDELREIERVDFLRAIDLYKRRTGKTFPSWTEVLDVLRGLGWVYPKSAEKLAGKKK